MKPGPLAVAAAAALALAAGAQPIQFDNEALGAPQGWDCGVTGQGRPHWAVRADPSRSQGRALLQSGVGTFPWCVRPDSVIANGYVATIFVPVSGRQGQSGGVVWRWKSGDDYYVARASALENNLSLYYVEHGRRWMLKYEYVTVTRGRPHVLRADFVGSTIYISFDGQLYIVWHDEHINGSGAVGVWTQADSVTAFREFWYGNAPR